MRVVRRVARSAALVALGLTVVGALTHRALREPPPERPSAHHLRRLAAFAEENARLEPARRHVVLVGDSLTELWGAHVRRHLPTLADRVLNRGISGDTTRDLAGRLDASVYATNPSHVVLNIGVNDLTDDDAAGPAGERFAALVRQLRERLPAVPLVVVTVAPCRGEYAVRNPWIVEYDEHVRRAAAASGCALIDLHSMVVDAQGELPAALALPDGLHWSEAMYERLGRELETTVLGAGR